MKKIIKEHEHFEKFMGYKAPEFKSDSGEFHVILWNLNYISNNKNEYAIGRLCLYLFIDKSDDFILLVGICLLYTSPSPRDKRQSRMPSSA